jgi:anti-sigma-K factor RskA
MRYDNPRIRDIVAAEYVLGTLTISVRKRFESLAASRSDWKLAASWWAMRLHLLADTLPAVIPRKQVWQKIETRLYGNKITAATSWWRILALSSASVTAAMVVLMITKSPEISEVPARVAVNAPAEVPEPVALALLSGTDLKPGWLLRLSKNKNGQPEIKVTTLNGVKLASDKSFELWILPVNKSAPISLGLLPDQGNKQLIVSLKNVELLQQGGLAVSLEPIGGSPTGQPTGAVLYQGKLIEI